MTLLLVLKVLLFGIAIGLLAWFINYRILNSDPLDIESDQEDDNR